LKRLVVTHSVLDISAMTSKIIMVFTGLQAQS
jgi:hypothetical protein